MHRLLLPLLLLATAASARSPAAVDRVTDRELLRLLSTQYDARARLHGDWASRSPTGLSRRLCADSGPLGGDRLVAVCSLPGAEGGRGQVDLLVVEPPASTQGHARIRARFRGIDHDAAGDVRLMAIAPDRLAFHVAETSRDAGWTRGLQSLYAERPDGLRRLLTVGSRLDNTGACSGQAGTRCPRRRVSLTCVLRADSSRPVAGAWPLELHVTGEREGATVDRVLPIAHDAYGYRIAARVLETQGCNGAA